MNETYREIYEDILDIYRQGHRLPWRAFPTMWGSHLLPDRTLRWVTKAVDEAVAEVGVFRQLRPDARLFLEINLHQLVALPMSHPESPNTPEGLREFLRNDAISILTAAHRRSEGQEISGHLLIQVISEAWPGLRLARLEIWG